MKRSRDGSICRRGSLAFDLTCQLLGLHRLLSLLKLQMNGKELTPGFGKISIGPVQLVNLVQNEKRYRNCQHKSADRGGHQRPERESALKPQQESGG